MIDFTHQTSLSRIVSIIVFIGLVPALSFYVGFEYMLTKHMVEAADQNVVAVYKDDTVATQKPRSSPAYTSEKVSEKGGGEVTHDTPYDLYDSNLPLARCKELEGQVLSIYDEESRRFLSEYVVQSEHGTGHGRMVARAVASDTTGYANYDLLYVNDELVAQNLATQYRGFGLQPLYWSLDNTRLYLMTRDVRNHGYQESTTFYVYDVATRVITPFVTLQGNATSMVKSCGPKEHLFVTLSTDGGMGDYTPPHRIVAIDLETGGQQLLKESMSGEVYMYDNLSIQPREHNLSFTVKYNNSEEVVSVPLE
jgi:hypothetical protein